jgi:tungstate transport system permease protein
MSELIEVTLRSLAVTGMATVLAALAGVPAGLVLALSDRRAARACLVLANAGMALPPVLVGLVVAMALWRTGPLGSLGLIYTPVAMVIAQAVIAFPPVVALTAVAVRSLEPDFWTQTMALGATRAQAAWVLLKQARTGLLAAVLAAFGAALSEVGAVMMVGGNITGQTRVLTTSVLAATRMGDFDRALGLGAVLLGLSVLVSTLLVLAQGRTWLRRPTP